MLAATPPADRARRARAPLAAAERPLLIARVVWLLANLDAEDVARVVGFAEQLDQRGGIK